MEDSTEGKQNYLRENILDKGYDPNEFFEFLMNKRGEEAANLDIWTCSELESVVQEFILSRPSPNAFQQEQPNQEQEQEQYQQEQNTEQNYTQQETNEYQDQQQEYNQQQYDQQQQQSEQKFIPCLTNETTEIGSYKDLTIKVSDPEKVEGGLFVKSYVSYLVTTMPMNIQVRKRYSDFEWLTSMLSAYYPGNILPPLPRKNFGDRFNENFLTKRMRALNKFFFHIVQDPLLRNSQFLYDFLTINDEKEFTNKKNIYNKQKAPTLVNEMKSLTGQLDITITEDRENYLTNIKNNSDINETLLKKLISNYKSLNDQLNAVSTRLIEISEIWTDLLKTAMEYSDEQYVISTYQLMSKVTRDWAELEKKQAALTNIDIREYFKNINKQSHCLKELSIKAEGHKNNFYRQQEKLLTKKEELFRQQNIDKWGIDNKDTTIDKGRLTSDKEYAFMKMLVKETEVVDNLKLNFGFYMNRTIEEYERVRTLNGVNHSNAIATYCQKHTAVIADLSTSLADIVAFLGDGTYLKEVVIEEKVKLGVRPVEKQNVKEDKNEEQQTQQQNEERNVDDTNNTNQDQQGNGEEIEETNMNENKAYGEEYIDNEGN